MNRFEVWLIKLDPTKGREIDKTRPCVVVSPNELNALKTRLVAPLTSTVRGWKCRVKSRFDGVDGEIALDQMRCVDNSPARAVRRLGRVDDKTARQITKTLTRMFQ